MKDSLFDTKKKVDAAVSGFTGLKNHPGWILFEQIMDANIKVVTKLILDGINLEGEKATQEETDRLRDKLRVYEEAKNTPDRMVKRLTSPVGEEPAVDPYQTVEQLKEERRKASA